MMSRHSAIAGILAILGGVAAAPLTSADTHLTVNCESAGRAGDCAMTLVADVTSYEHNTRPLIPHGSPYDKARAMLMAAGWYPFKSKGLWSSGIYIDPEIVQNSSVEYQKFLLDQRNQSASWFYNRGMMEIVDCHPQTGQCSALFSNGINEEVLITTNSGREERGVPKVDRVDFQKAQLR